MSLCPRGTLQRALESLQTALGKLSAGASQGTEWWVLGLNAHMCTSFLIVKVTPEESFALSQTQFPHLEAGIHTNHYSSVRVVLSKIFFEKQFRGLKRWLSSLATRVFAEDQIRSPVLTWQLTIICNFCFGDQMLSSEFFGYHAYVHAGKRVTYIRQIFKKWRKSI